MTGKISIIIPIKNEPYVNTLIEEIHDALKAYDHEIIVVDKSKEDVKIVGAEKITQTSDGLGNAFLEGLAHVGGDVVVLMDGDGSHRPIDLPKLIEELKNFDMVVGSRFAEGGKNFQAGFYRRVLSIFMCKFTSLVLGLNVKDSMSGFAAVKRRALDGIELRTARYKILLEMMYKVKVKGYRIGEAPIIFEKRKSGETKAGISRNGVKELVALIKLIFKLKWGTREFAHVRGGNE